MSESQGGYPEDQPVTLDRYTPAEMDRGLERVVEDMGRIILPAVARVRERSSMPYEPSVEEEAERWDGLS